MLSGPWSSPTCLPASFTLLELQRVHETVLGPCPPARRPAPQGDEAAVDDVLPDDRSKDTKVTKTPAQTLLDAVIRSALVPLLKAERFRKTGHTFRQATPRCVLVVNVQSSSGSNHDALKFTVNLGAFYPELNEVLGRGSWADPGATGPTEAHCHIRERLGMLTSNPSDRWWELRTGASPQDASNEVMELVRDRGLPWLRSLVDVESARRHAEERGQAVEAAAFFILEGRRDEARKLLADFLVARPNATAIRAWARQLGLVE